MGSVESMRYPRLCCKSQRVSEEQKEEEAEKEEEEEGSQ